MSRISTPLPAQHSIATGREHGIPQALPLSIEAYWWMDFGPLAWSLVYPMERIAYQLGSARFMYMDGGKHWNGIAYSTLRFLTSLR